MPKYEVIWVEPSAKKDFIKLCEKWNKKQVVLATQMVEYFKETGHNPLDTKVSAPAEEMKQLRNTLVSFIRTQETKILLPMVEKVDKSTQELAKFISEARGEVLGKKKAKSSSASSSLLEENGSAEVVSEEAPVLENESEHVTKEILELKIQLEKKEKENEEVKQKLKTLEKKIVYESTGFNKAYVLKVSKPEYNQLFKGRAY